MNAVRNLTARRLAAGALALSLLGTGVASLAQVSDSLTTTSNFSVLSADLQAGTDGTTYANSLTLDWTFEAGITVNRLVYLTNAGNGPIQTGGQSSTMKWSWSATGATSFSAASFRAATVSSAANCPATGTATTNQQLVYPDSYVGSDGATGTTSAITIQPGASAMVCLSIIPKATLLPQVGDTGQQVLVIPAVANL